MSTACYRLHDVRLRPPGKPPRAYINGATVKLVLEGTPESKTVHIYSHDKKVVNRRVKFTPRLSKLFMDREVVYVYCSISHLLLCVEWEVENQTW